MAVTRSLAQDDVDWCNNTVAFIFFLLLGFFTLLVLPLTPTLEFNGNGRWASRSSAVAAVQRRPKPPKVSLTCWGPAQFMEWNHVRYMDTYCGQQMIIKLRGTSDDHNIYRPFEFLKPPRSSYRESKGINSNSSTDDDKDVVEKRNQQQQQQLQQRLMKTDKAQKKLRDLVYYKAPLVLLLVAFLFEAAHVLCSMMRNALPSGVNVDQILDRCVGSRSLKLADQSQILEETAEDLIRECKDEFKALNEEDMSK